MKERRLTDKQEKFCLAVANGHTQYEAYKIAYETKTENRQVIDNNAYLVAKNPKIRARVEELRKMRDLQDLYADINDINKIYRLIWERITACKEKGDDAGIARYLNEIGKLTGNYEAHKKPDTNITNVFNGLSDEELKNLLSE